MPEKIIVTKNNHTISFKAKGLPEVYFYTDELALIIPSPALKSPVQAILWAQVVIKAAEEFKKYQK